MSKNKANNKELSARLMAVQAYYQALQNKTPARLLAAEFLERGLETDEGEEIAAPHGGLFKKILFSLDERSLEINEILNANINKNEVPVIAIVVEEEEGEDQEEKPTPPPEKEIEPLLKSILLCGVCELLAHQEIDAALIINDYLNVTHAFYEKQQVSFVNGVLDKVSSLLR